MYSILETRDILVRMLRSWAKMKVDQNRFTSMCATVGTSATFSCTITPPGSTRKGAHTYRTFQWYV